jgi:hypothetical protein
MDPELVLLKRKIEKRLNRRAQMRIKILVPRWLYLLLKQKRPPISVRLNL